MAFHHHPVPHHYWHLSSDVTTSHHHRETVDVMLVVCWAHDAPSSFFCEWQVVAKKASGSYWTAGVAVKVEVVKVTGCCLVKVKFTGLQQ